MPFRIDPAGIDEAAVKRLCRERGDGPEEASLSLAESKAADVSPRHPGAFVLGADQLLVSGPDWLDKPETPEQVRASLVALRGCRHRLVSGLVVVCDGVALWRHVESAELVMRAYTDRFVDWYLETALEEALNVVGACRLEGVGAQALEAVRGDHFTVLGLPLLPLLDFLRREGILVS